MDAIILLAVALGFLLIDLYVASQWRRTRRSTIELKDALDQFAGSLDKRAADLESTERCLSAWGQALVERDTMLSGYFIAVADEVADRGRNEDGAE